MSDPLPIDDVLPALCRSLSENNRCLLVAQPGAGKTTRAPLALLEQENAKDGRWLLLEPRRVAARLAAGYMASQLGEDVGRTVGYRVRGESKVSGATRLEVVTQGILTRMLQDDPFLDGVSGIVFDEFHERSLEGDLGLALALDVQESLREDLKLLVMSATLDVDSLLAMLGGNTPVIDCPGRTWPVETCYRPAPAREAAEIHQAKVIREALDNGEGDILVFLPGQREIRRLHDQLQKSLAGDIGLYQLHGRLPLKTQREVLQAHDPARRRVVLATDIAESSVTVPGVRVVVDAGRERVPVYQPRSGLTRLETRQVNRASADQRRGRAGREAAGSCYRLWSSELPLAPHREPEILQSDLSGLVYELLRWGTPDPGTLSWVTPPPAPACAAAMTLLETLGLVDETGNLTPLGRRCSRWPAHPRLAVLLDRADSTGDLSLASWLVALLEENISPPDTDLQPLIQRAGDSGLRDDLSRWRRSAGQWCRRLKSRTVPDSSDTAAELLAAAYPDRIGENRGGGKFRLAGGGQAKVPESHPLANEGYLVITDLDGRAGGGNIHAAIAISPAAIESLFPQTLEWQSESRWEDKSGRLVSEEVRRLGHVVLARRPGIHVDPEAVRAALVDAVRMRGSFKWSNDDRQLLGRLQLLHRVLGPPWPDVSEQKLMETLDQWLAPHLDGVNSLEKLDNLPLGQLVLHTLDWPLPRDLDRLAPAHFQVPSGSRVKIDYTGDEPVLAVKLQEMFGRTDTPTIVDGRVPLTVHLLSPARRPVQVTRDLAGFWQTTYFEVRKDLKGRYPKHPWPDDPLAATPTRHTNRRS